MPKKHIVRAGDCIASIAHAHGFAPDTLWNHTLNDALRKTRPAGNQLVPGDAVLVPDLRGKTEPGATDRCHCFRRVGVPERLRLQLMDVTGPRANIAYVLEIDGGRIEGTTDGEGCLAQPISPAVMRGTLTVGDEVYVLQLGHLQPVSTEAGVRARLHNLGFLPDEGAASDALTRAIGCFQAHNQLTVTQDLDQPTRARLEEAHGS